MYHVFAGDRYYPGGGAEDFKGSRDSIESALEFVASIECDWWQITNHELKIIKYGFRNYD